MLHDPYDRRGRVAVMVVAVSLPLLLAMPVIGGLARAGADTGIVLVRGLWLLLPAGWSVRLLSLVARRQRSGQAADEQTLLLYRTAMMVPVIGYVPMLWWR